MNAVQVVSLVVAAVFAAGAWCVWVCAREARADAEREISGAEIRAQVMAERVALATEVVLRAPTVERPKLRLRTVTDELGEWTPAAHPVADARTFDEVAQDFFSLRRWMTEPVPA